MLYMMAGRCRHVSNHQFSRDVGDFDSFQNHFITNVTVLDIDMLGPRVKNWIMGQCYQSLVIAF